MHLNALKDYFLKKWDVSFQSLFQTANKMQDINNAFSFCTGTVDLALQLTTYILIGLSVIAGKLTIGFFIVVTNYITQINVLEIRLLIQFQKKKRSSDVEIFYFSSEI